MSVQRSEPNYSWGAVPALAKKHIADGENALARINEHVKLLIHDWRAVGTALGDMQREAMRQAGIQRPVGRSYNAAWATLAADHPRLAKLEKEIRHHAMWLADHWEAVEAWHAELGEEVQRMINHPATIHRRFDRDHPMPRKAAKEGLGAPDLGDDDETDNDDETEKREVYGLGDGDRDDDDDRDDDESPQKEQQPDWLDSVEEAWAPVASILRRAPLEVRREAALRIFRDLELLDGDSETAELLDEVDQVIDAHNARESRDAAKTVAAIRPNAEPTPERMAQVVDAALRNPPSDDEDIFAGLGDEVGSEQISPARVFARKPGLSVRASRVIAARMNDRDADDETLAQQVGPKITAKFVRRVLDENGFGK